MTYTKDNPNKFFLNDKSIAQELKYGDIQLNAIPSLDLVSSLYNQLSTEDKRQNDYIVSVETSAYTISSNVDARLLQLSNTLSTYANSLCAAVSSQVDVNRTNDKAELSNTLSNYTNSKVLDLSTSLSDEVNAKFVHKAGDSMTGSLSVASDLIIDGLVTLKNNTKILNNLTQGKNTYVHNDIDRGIAMGISAVADQNDAFVWNGDDTKKDYNAQDNKPGSFNINPRGEVNGFYIGSRNLSTVIHDDVQLTSNNLTAQISTASALVSAWVDADRIADKAELSNVLSSYTNAVSNEMSATIDTNRATDHLSSTAEAFGYVEDLSGSLSNFIDAAKYSVIDKVGFAYNDQTHIITLSVADQLNNTKTMTIDSSDFIKNRIVDHVDVVTPTQDPKLSETVLRIWWTPDEGSTVGIYTDIPISQLAKVYTAGDGINISENLKISVVDYTGITACLNQTSANVATLSNSTIPAIDNRLALVEAYATELSAPVFGKIDTLSIDLHKLSDNISADVNSLSNVVVAGIRTDVDAVSARADRLQNYADQLSGASGWIGDIPFLSNEISTTRREIRGAANFCGYVSMSKYHADWLDASRTNTLSTFFRYMINRGTEAPVKNGNIYEIRFIEEPGFSLNDPVYAADQYWEFTDEPISEDGKKIKFAHNDYVAVYIPDGTIEIPLEKLNANNVRVISDTRFHEHNQLSNTTFGDMIWLSGGNNLTARYNVEISVDGHNPGFVTKTGHAISGNNDIYGDNHFLVGNNRFDGYNFIEKLSTYTLSSENLSASDVEIDDLSAFLIKTDHLSAYKLSADQISATLISVNNLSGCMIEADGISAYEVSADKLSAYDVDVYDLSVGSNAKITGNLSVDNKLTASTELAIQLETKIANKLSVANEATFNSTAYVNNNLTVNNVLTATVATQTADVVKLSAGQLTADFANVYDSGANSTKYNTLNAFETSVELSTQNLSAYVRKIQNNVNEIYRNVSAINNTSNLSDVISAVVEIAHKLSTLTAVQY